MSGGGAATSSGIDFQHRVGAVAMLAMATDVQVLRWLWRDARDEVVTEVRFETRDAIDDLLIVTDGSTVLVQAKRSLSFSTAEASEFASVLRQFVDQFANAPEANDVYLLATSPAASGRIRVDLRKLTEAARLNELGPAANPLTGPEEELLEKTRGLIERLFAERTGRVMAADPRARGYERGGLGSLTRQPAERIL